MFQPPEWPARPASLPPATSRRRKAPCGAPPAPPAREPPALQPSTGSARGGSTGGGRASPPPVSSRTSRDLRQADGVDGQRVGNNRQSPIVPSRRERDR